MESAEKVLPNDKQLKQISEGNMIDASIVTEPAGAEVEIQDYLTPGAAWVKLGTTPLQHVRLPKGYFRWKVSKQGFPEMLQAWDADTAMDFSLTDWQQSPAGMVPTPGGELMTYEGFLGWIGPYKLPPFYVDRFEVTNREFQQFADVAPSPEFSSESAPGSCTVNLAQSVRSTTSMGIPAPVGPTPNAIRARSCPPADTAPTHTPGRLAVAWIQYAPGKTDSNSFVLSPVCVASSCASPF
jgi:hypothetical protein